MRFAGSGVVHLVERQVPDWHRRAAYTLRNMPVLIYGGTTPVPAQVDAIVGELKAVLGK
jgi:hypothetical protein